MPQNLGFDVELQFPFNDAIGRVKDALKQEGFGILTEIDLQAAFREKLGTRVPAVRDSRRVQPSASILCHQR